MAITTHKLICIRCNKTEEYVDLHPHNQQKPKNWYVLQPNYRHSEWSSLDYSVGGDLCSFECILAYIQEAIIERDNHPKPFFANGGFIIE